MYVVLSHPGFGTSLQQLKEIQWLILFSIYRRFPVLLTLAWLRAQSLSLFACLYMPTLVDLNWLQGIKYPHYVHDSSPYLSPDLQTHVPTWLLDISSSMSNRLLKPNKFHSKLLILPRKPLPPPVSPISKILFTDQLFRAGEGKWYFTPCFLYTPHPKG